MIDPIDDLVLQWKQNPSADATVALCDALRGSVRTSLVQQVGEFSTQRHGGDVSVMLAVARMYLESHRLADAQAALLAAGKVAPREAAVYRWLGEVLLRRGDAERAEKVLERAIQLGAADDDVRLWLERAQVYRPMQAKAGARAVAAEVARAAAVRTPLPSRAPFDSLSESPTEVRSVPQELRAEARARAPHTAPALRPRVTEDSVTAALPRAALATPPPPAAAPPPAFGDRTEPFPPAQATHAETTPGAFPAPLPAAAGGRPTTDLAATYDDPRGAAALASTFERGAHAGVPPAPAPRARVVPAAELPQLEATHADPGSAFDPNVIPHPRDVLDALEAAGVFEPPAHGQPVLVGWDRPERAPRRRGTLVLAIATVLLAGAGAGGYYAYLRAREKAHQEAEGILVQVEAELHASKVEAFPATEQKLGTVFDLESRSPGAALAWLRERALVGLLKGGENIAFEDGMSRAREVGIRDDRFAFAMVASFLFQGDTSGAAALLPKWDGPAASDAYYQLVAGAVLERIGDGRAKERYAAASKLDPDLVAAQVMLARALALDGETEAATTIAKALRAKQQGRAEATALLALAWARSTPRGDAPPEVEEATKRGAELPLGLAFVPHAVGAVRALDKRTPAGTDEAKQSIQKGLAAADGPGVAAWLGMLALATGDEGLARSAALSSVRFSAVYTPARVLAARVALLGGRLDEALKATEDLDASSGDVAVVRAAVAYERADDDALGRALDGVSADVRKLPFFAPLQGAPAALAGRGETAPAKLVELAAGDAPWGDLIAMDLALDQGQTDTAEKIAARWPEGGKSPSRAVRQARLARYQGKLELAESASLLAMSGTVTARALWERVFVLVARGKAADVGPLLAKYPLVKNLAPTWLSAYAAASAGKADDAKTRTSGEPLPPALAPLPVRVIAAAALGAMKDKKRGEDYVREVLGAAPANPDAAAAGPLVGLKRTEQKGQIVWR